MRASDLYVNLSHAWFIGVGFGFSIDEEGVVDRVAYTLQGAPLARGVAPGMRLTQVNGMRASDM